MEYLFALIAVVVMTFVSGWILDKIASDIYFREQHVFFAGFNTVVAVAVSSWFSAPLLPVIALAGGTFGAWCVYRLCHRRPDQMILWDKIDMRFLGLAVLVGIGAACLTASLLSVPMLGALWPLFVMVVGWLLLFPL